MIAKRVTVDGLVEGGGDGGVEIDTGGSVGR